YPHGRTRKASAASGFIPRRMRRRWADAHNSHNWTRNSHDAYIERVLFRCRGEMPASTLRIGKMREGQTRQSNRAEQEQPRERHACATRALRNREASMNKTAEVVATVSVAVAALTGSASAQNSQGSAMIDSGLRE